MKKSKTFAVRVAAAVAKFRILRDWNITTSKTFAGTNYGLVSFGEPSLGDDLRRANIYPWTGRDDEPVDYVLHSVIEIALRALELHKVIDTLDDICDVQDRFVQNLCELILKE